MKKILLSVVFVSLTGGTATAGTSPRYNEPSASRLPASASHPHSEPRRSRVSNGEKRRKHSDPSHDITGSIPLVTKSGVMAARPILGPPHWTGFYLGVNVGAGWANTRLVAPGIANFGGVGMYGAAAGVTGGFDYRFSPTFVAGIAADGNVNSTSAKGSIGMSGDTTFREAGSWALRGRFGVVASEESLIYVTAGVSQVLTDLSFPNGGGRRSARYTGAIFGAGIETRLAGNLYGRVEYLHGVYDKRSFAGGLDAQPDAGLARIGLVYRPTEAADWAIASTPPVRESWTGAHIGLHGGWGSASTRLSSANAFTADGIGGSGPVGGALLGYDYQLGSSVFGLEIDGGAGGVKSSVAVPPLSAQITYEWDYSLRARAGHLVGDTLLFGAAGWSQAYGRLSTVGIGGLAASHVFSGFQFGGGMETMLTSQVGARIEYLQTFYDKYAAVLGSSLDARPTAGKTRAAVVYKF